MCVLIKQLGPIFFIGLLYPWKKSYGQPFFIFKPKPKTKDVIDIHSRLKRLSSSSSSNILSYFGRLSFWLGPAEQYRVFLQFMMHLK